MLIRPFAVLGLVLGAQLAGCGLISSDVTNFDLALQPKKFTINAGSWQLDADQASAYTSHSCAAMPTSCSELVAQVCPMGCSGTCNTRQTCDLTLNVSLAQPINLVTEHPELKSINDQPVVKVEIDSVTYEVTSNSLNVDTPTITVFVAPSSVTSVDGLDDAAQAIGMIEPIQAGATTASPRPMKFTAAGEVALANIMGTFKTPFNVLIGTQILVTQGSKIPTGKLEAVVHINGHAGL
jgi:hypothetical protein